MTAAPPPLPDERPSRADQTALQCPACGGQRVYDPDAEALRCASCGTVDPIAVPETANAAAEFPFDPDAPPQHAPASELDYIHSCQTCGGEVVFVGPSLSQRCPYCDGPVVLKLVEAGHAPTAVIPFKIGEAEAAERAAAWVAKRWAAPRDLLQDTGEGHFAGLYAPFWTFDAQEIIDYTARYKQGTNKNARWVKTSGRTKLIYDDLLMPASSHVTALIRDGIMHEFNPRRLRPYTAAYLAGFAAERHAQSVSAGLAANRKDIDVLIRKQVRRAINRRAVSDIVYTAVTSGVKFRRILLPVWILHYKAGEQHMRVVVSGIDGRTFGERPFSRAKLLLFAAALAVPAFLLGALYGMAVVQ